MCRLYKYTCNDVCNAVGDPIIYREKVGITLTGFNTATCLCLPQARPGFP